MKCPNTGKTLEPIEEVVCEMDEDHSNLVISSLLARKGIMEEMEHTEVRSIRSGYPQACLASTPWG